jgi:hypothetical protein
VTVSSATCSEFTMAPAGRLDFKEVGMSGGFCHIVLRLVETGYSPPFSAARTIP